MFGVKQFISLMAVMLIVSACNGGASPAMPTSQVEIPTTHPTDTPAPYPDTPLPPTIKAPLAESPSLLSVQFVNTLDGWGVTETQIVRTNDGGTTWYNVAPKDITELGYGVRLFVLDTQYAWLLKADANNDPNAGFLYRTTDGGITWTMFDAPFGEGVLSFVDGDNGWALASLGIGAGSNAVAIFQTIDGGITWTQKYTNDPNDSNARDSLPLGGLKAGIAPLNMNTAWVYGVTYASGDIYLFRTDDGGVSWSEPSLPLPPNAENLYLGIDPSQMKFVSSDAGYIAVRIVGDTNQVAIYVTHNAGNTWTLTPTLIPAGRAADFMSAQEAVIYNGEQFYVTRDAAQTWSIIPPNIKFGDTFANMDFVNASTGWVITQDPTTNHRSLYRTNDGGATWLPIVP